MRSLLCCRLPPGLLLLHVLLPPTCNWVLLRSGIHIVFFVTITITIRRYWEVVVVLGLEMLPYTISTLLLRNQIWYWL